MQTSEAVVSDATSDEELSTALDPRTYETEWGDRSPEQVRAMSWALSLVRARLGVDLKP